MPEVKKEVKTYLVNYECDSCGNGEMRFTGAMIMDSPPQYPHKCDHCGEIKHLSTRPTLELSLGDNL